MKPIKLEFFAPSGEPHTYIKTRSVLCHSHRKARKLAAETLGTVVATQYTVNRELERAPSARIESRRGRGVWVTPEVRIVPSVGEQGWTP